MSTTISRYTYPPTSYIPPIWLFDASRRDSAIDLSDDYYSSLSNVPPVTKFGQIHVLTHYLFTPGTLQRAPALLAALHDSTLLRGAKMLHERIEDLIAVELRMYRTYASMLSDREYDKVALVRTGWQWAAISGSVLEALDRKDMEEQLGRDLDMYDCVAESVRKWKGKIAERIGKRRVELRKRRPWEV